MTNAQRNRAIRQLLTTHFPAGEIKVKQGRKVSALSACNGVGPSMEIIFVGSWERIPDSRYLDRLIADAGIGLGGNDLDFRPTCISFDYQPEAR